MNAQMGGGGDSLWFEHWHTKLFILWVFFMALVSLSVYLQMNAEMLVRRRDTLKTMCEGRARMLENQFLASMNHVRALTALFTTLHISKQIAMFNQETFSQYAESTAFERPLMSGVAYADRVLHEDRESFEMSHGWTIKEMFSKEKQQVFEEYAPATMSQDTVSYLTSLDMMSGQEDRENILRARASGKGALTNPFRLLESKHLGVVFTFAVYSIHLPPDATPDERVKATAGYLGGAFDVETLVENLLHGFPGSEMIAVNVYDITNELCPLVMYGHTNVSKSENTYVSSLDFGDPQRKHEMRCRYNEDALPPWTAISTSVGIFVIGFLVGHMLHASRNRIDKVEENCRMFKELKVLADEASVAKSQFLATVSHEIRTPMNGVLGMLQMLMDTRLDATQQDYARTAQASGKALITLINEVLDQAKIESGRLELEAVPFDLCAILDDVLSLFSGKSRDEGIELAVYISEKVPSILIGDPGRFRQIIINLVGNSIKFTERGHIFVCVHLSEDMEMVMEGSDYSGDDDDYSDWEVDGPGCVPLDMKCNQFNTLSGYETADDRNSWETFELLLAQEQHSYNPDHDDHHWNFSDGNDVVNLVVSVEDTGVGIPLHVQERVFTPFMQADSSTSRTYGGTGIGLSISKCLVELMSGKMRFVSRPKIGSTFTFTAKFQQMHNSVHESMLRNTNSVLQVRLLPTCFQGMQALVVDGRPVRSEVTRHHLRRLGVQVMLILSLSQSECSAAAFHSTVGGGIDMILVDKDAWGAGTGIRFPHMLCQSASEHLRQRNKYFASSVGLSHGFIAARLPKMMLVATSMTDNEHKLARENGFTDSVVIKPLRASMLSACLQQALGVWNRRDQGRELREGSRSLHKLLSGKRVLVVDDNPVNRRVAEGALLKYGAQVECVNSGRAAIVKLKPPHNFDACFMDVQMPEMDGFEATEIIRKAEMEASECMSGGILTKYHPVRIPILAMTADVIQATQAECLLCGMDGYVAKPFEEQQLYNAVAHFFEAGYV
ncbi:unnamed protein product [Sphagnum tenellum]